MVKRKETKQVLHLDTSLIENRDGKFCQWLARVEDEALLDAGSKATKVKNGGGEVEEAMWRDERWRTVCSVFPFLFSLSFSLFQQFFLNKGVSHVKTRLGNGMVPLPPQWHWSVVPISIVNLFLLHPSLPQLHEPLISPTSTATATVFSQPRRRVLLPPSTLLILQVLSFSSSLSNP